MLLRLGRCNGIVAPCVPWASFGNAALAFRYAPASTAPPCNGGSPASSSSQCSRKFGRFATTPLGSRTWGRGLRLWCSGHRLITTIWALVFGFGAYVGICTLVHRQHRPTIDALFNPQEDYMLEDWAAVEPTLREGDVILLMGTGKMSWKITNSQFVYAMMRPAALRYSHVAVVVEPAVMERWPRHGQGGSRLASVSDLLRQEWTGKPRKQKRGALIMEAVDNKDINAPDRRGIVRHECVQVVEANKRISGKQDDRWCYNRFAVRRLKGFEWTHQRKQMLQQFLQDNEGRPMDTSPLIMLAFIHPKLYEWTGSRKGREISCSELIVDLYKYCGVIEKHWMWEPVGKKTHGAQTARPAVGGGNTTGGTTSSTTAKSTGKGSGSSHEDVVPYDAPEEVLLQQRDGTNCRLVSYFKRPSIQTAPFHFAEGMEVGVLDFAGGVYLGPEVRMKVPHPTSTPDTLSELPSGSGGNNPSNRHGAPNTVTSNTAQHAPTSPPVNARTTVAT